MNKLKALILCLLLSVTTYGQTIKEIKTDIFTVTYSEIYQQPLKVSYTVACPDGSASRKGMGFYKNDSIITSDSKDYVSNVWDKGHMAPAADFNCDKETIRKTFTYLNCALQHRGLNRGPWKELERYERVLAKTHKNVLVIIILKFEDIPERWLDTGALVPIGFTKIIMFDDIVHRYYFPNKNVAGIDWREFRTQY